jgi:hypothetical protein
MKNISNSSSISGWSNNDKVIKPEVNTVDKTITFDKVEWVKSAEKNLKDLINLKSKFEELSKINNDKSLYDAIIDMDATIRSIETILN